MKIDYKNDIFVWKREQDERLAVPDNTISIPSPKELFFESKLDEIQRQYSSARIFLSQVDNSDWKYWFEPSENDSHNAICKTGFNEIFLETSIMYYNIVVDLTWTLCYVCAEFAITVQGERTSLEDIKEITETEDAFRKLESYVSNPSDEGNPFNYLKTQSPEYAPAIELICSFWNDFSNSEIRSLYNFLKHKGKPQYTEMYEYAGKKFFSVHMEGTELPTDINDVRREISLYDMIGKLVEYDDNKLFPYCNKLFDLLIPLVYG